MTVCHVVSHVHWDREWYRTFESFRSRLVELVEHVCAELESGAMAGFHLDGQTVTLSDVLAVRPDLAGRIRRHVVAGRLTIGPWHVLADNQLVSGENMIRNLFAARRAAEPVGGLTPIGYSPDAFGHPGDLPRVLRGFGLDTALVWRGAPAGAARFRWRAPDGSEVYAVNQAYHEAEVLWEDAGRRLAAFLDRERERCGDGPWLLLNGGDHLAPSGTTARVAELGGPLRESTLPAFFAAARAADPEPPLVTGELRHPGGRLTFLLPGTLSARTPLKQANWRAQTLLERWAEPYTALSGRAEQVPNLRHAWDLLLKNAPHDSICGCSVDEVHRENMTRFDRVTSAGEQVLNRCLGALGLDVRLYGDPCADEAVLAVLNPHGGPVTQGVEADVLTAPGRYPRAVYGPDGESIPFESVTIGPEKAFEADLDLLPDTRDALRHRVALLAQEVPPLGWAAYRIELGGDPVAVPETSPGRRAQAGPYTLEAGGDATVTVSGGGRVFAGLGLLEDVGDRGDAYTFDPVPDAPVHARLSGSSVTVSPVRTRLSLRAVLDLPAGLDDSRERRSRDTVAVPVTVDVTCWHGTPELHWDVRLDNRAGDHRLRLLFPAGDAPGEWLADAHFSLVRRPVEPELGPLPDEPAMEARHPVAPAQTFGSAGSGAGRVFVAAPGLPEMQGLPGRDGDVLAVTLLRAVGWLSRFDLRTRTTGAGPQLPVPEAQCRGPQRFGLVVRLGDADDLTLAHAAAQARAPMRAVQARPGTAVAPRHAGPRLAGGLLTALKPAEDGDGYVLRVSNPTGETVTAGLTLPEGAQVSEARLDETAYPAAELALEEFALPPYALRTFRVR
ncbi:glycosyl hydrolase-related protein [Nonomuraea terrae]|uniref:glycoside hydrolase family 38 N-terminal domain-containing protein n=1 Tax=Nonomuraea terrae TaxID=2530383 RepID=UPI0037B2874F